MQYFERSVDLSFTNKKSCFLFGPRQTGKSSLLKKRFPHTKTIDLLLSENYLKYSAHPELLRQEVLALPPESSPIIIDEIQKIPLLLNEVHYLIEKGYKFILTGSSARKLKRGAANLLGGRARERRLFPLTTFELEKYDLLKIINIGSLPAIYTSDDPRDDLMSYVGTYLKEEIQAEGLVRGIHQFSHFLEMAAIMNTELLNFAKIASDVSLNPKTIKEYFLILEDTLIGHTLPPYTKTTKRKSVSTSKFYFFDVGVANALAKRFSIEKGSELFGKCFEHFIFCEIRSYLSYQKDYRTLSFWRSKNRQEVDFLIGDDVAIEVKATNRVQKKHLKGLKALSEENLPFKHKIVVSLDSEARKLEDGIMVEPYHSFLEKLWKGIY